MSNQHQFLIRHSGAGWEMLRDNSLQQVFQTRAQAERAAIIAAGSSVDAQHPTEILVEADGVVTCLLRTGRHVFDGGNGRR